MHVHNGDLAICKVFKEDCDAKKPAAKSMNITVNELKQHFESVSHERYEEEHGAVEREKDLREWRRVIEANELMNEVPERAMKDYEGNA